MLWCVYVESSFIFLLPVLSGGVYFEIDAALCKSRIEARICATLQNDAAGQQKFK